MNFLRLRDYLLAPIFENEDIIAINKPYGFNTHTNDSKAGNEELIEHGLIEIFEKQLGYPLHIIHRLDRTTTGVLVFGKSQDSAKKYKKYFFDRQAKKTYHFLTASKSQKKNFTTDQVIVHKGKELTAKTELYFQKKSSFYELWEAWPLTGRNHQIRIHAKACEIAILGDELYDGKRFPFLCLHNSKIEFPNGVAISANAPIYFDDLTLLEDKFLSEILHERDRRIRLFPSAGDDQCYRLVHKKNFAIDQYGGKLFLTEKIDRLSQAEKISLEKFASIVGKSLVSEESTEVWQAKEDKVSYELRSGDLFLDQRLIRSWLRENARDQSVLNLFSGNCALGLSAALGGASEVSCVDIRKSNLAVGRKNFELNGLDPNKQYKFYLRDSFAFLVASAKKQKKFDLVIAHFPAFFRGEKRTFRIETDLEDFTKLAVRCLAPKGKILILTNAQDLIVDDIRKVLVSSVNGKNQQISFILSPTDFELVEERPGLKAYLLINPGERRV